MNEAVIIDSSLQLNAPLVASNLPLWQQRHYKIRHILLTLESDHADLVQNKRILWSDLKRLREKSFRQFRVICQTVFQTDVEQRQMTSKIENSYNRSQGLTFQLIQILDSLRLILKNNHYIRQTSNRSYVWKKLPIFK